MDSPHTADHYKALARAPNTLRAYAADWRDFAAWCQAAGQPSLPAAPATIGDYLAARAETLKPSTLKRRLAAIVVRHRQAGQPLDPKAPVIADVLSGIRRAKGAAPAQKEALAAEDLRLLVDALPTTLAGLRDRAVLLLGFAGAFRRSELAALTTRDLVWTSDGIAVCLRSSKGDQERAGTLKAIPFGRHEASCPVKAVRRWVMAAGLDQGPLFRPIDAAGNLSGDGLSGAAIAAIVKRAVRTLARHEQVSAAEIARRMAAVAGHSLRAGFITTAAATHPEWAIQKHTGHKQVSTLRAYIRRGDMFATSPATGIGL